MKSASQTSSAIRAILACFVAVGTGWWGTGIKDVKGWCTRTTQRRKRRRINLLLISVFCYNEMYQLSNVLRLRMLLVLMLASYVKPSPTATTTARRTSFQNIYSRFNRFMTISTSFIMTRVWELVKNDAGRNGAN